MTADGLFLKEVSEMYEDWHVAKGTLQFVVLGLFDTPSRSSAMKAAEEEQVVQIRPNHDHFL